MYSNKKLIYLFLGPDYVDIKVPVILPQLDKFIKFKLRLGLKEVLFEILFHSKPWLGFTSVNKDDSLIWFPHGHIEFIFS